MGLRSFLGCSFFEIPTCGQNYSGNELEGPKRNLKNVFQKTHLYIAPSGPENIPTLAAKKDSVLGQFNNPGFLELLHYWMFQATNSYENKEHMMQRVERWGRISIVLFCSAS